MSSWVWLISDVNGLPHRVPEAVVAFYAARGFQVTDIDGEFDSDSEEFAAALEEWQSAKGEEIEQQWTDLSPATGESTDEAKSATNKKELNNG